MPFLRWINAPERLITPFTVTGVNNVAVTYLLYKLVTPFRYMTTIGGTQQAVKYLRRWGYLPPAETSGGIRSIMNKGKSQMKAKMDSFQGEVKKK